MTTFVRTYPPATAAPGPAILLPFLGSEMLVNSDSDNPALLRGDAGDIAGLAGTEPLYLGTRDGLPCLTWNVDEKAVLPQTIRPVGLRALLATLSEEDAMLAGYAAQIRDWQRTSRFCPVCGHATEPKNGDWGRHCPNCGYDRYPHVSPAVLVLVHDGDRVLLSHKPEWGNMRSILAGFVEPGESLEGCVHREVMEEVGLEIADLVYQGSQPWPFPHQLMVGFTARYVRGDIRIDEHELDEAAWFTRDALPHLPSLISLSRRLLDAWVGSGA